MEKAVRKLFDRYERLFMRGLAGDFDEVEAKAMYTPEFIAAWPGGVKAGKNNDTLTKALRKDFERNRKIGTQAMRIRRIGVTLIDNDHGVAKIAWTATYRRDDLPEIAIDFEVCYLVQLEGEAAKIFGWIVGDEQALLKEHRVI